MFFSHADQLAIHEADREDERRAADSKEAAERRMNGGRSIAEIMQDRASWPDMSDELASDAEIVESLNRTTIRLVTKSGKELRVLETADWKQIARDFAAQTGEAVKIERPTR